MAQSTPLPSLTGAYPEVGDRFIEKRPMRDGDRLCLVEIVGKSDTGRVDVLYHGYCDAAGTVTEPLGFTYRGEAPGVFRDARFYVAAPVALSAAA